MRKIRAVTVVLATLLPLSAVAQDARTVVEDVAKTMGADNLTSITYSGAAAVGNFGQSRTISFGLASTAIRNYVRTIDFTLPALRTTGDTQPPAAVRGGSLPPMGTYSQSITAANGGVGAADGDLGDAVGIPARARSPTTRP